MKVNSKAENFTASIREQLQLKNEVQTKGLFGMKKRFAILTNQRFLLFESKQDYLVNKNPRKCYSIKQFEYLTEGRELHIFQSIKSEKMKLIKKIFYPNIELCIQWWETIKNFKYDVIPFTALSLEENIKSDIKILTNPLIPQIKSQNENALKTQNFAKQNLKEINSMIKKWNVIHKRNFFKRSRNCSFEIKGQTRKSESINFKESNFNINIESVKKMDTKGKEDPVSFKHKQKSKNENLNVNFSNSSFKINSEGQTKLKLVINNFSRNDQLLNKNGSDSGTASEKNISLEISNSNSIKNNIHIFQNNKREKYINNYNLYRTTKVKSNIEETSVSQFNDNYKSFDENYQNDKLNLIRFKNDKKLNKTSMLEDKVESSKKSFFDEKNFDHHEKFSNRDNCKFKYANNLLAHTNKFDENKNYDITDNIFRNILFEKNSKYSTIKESNESSENKRSKKLNSDSEKGFENKKEEIYEKIQGLVVKSKYFTNNQNTMFHEANENLKNTMTSLKKENSNKRLNSEISDSTNPKIIKSNILNSDSLRKNVNKIKHTFIQDGSNIIEKKSNVSLTNENIQKKLRDTNKILMNPNNEDKLEETKIVNDNVTNVSDGISAERYTHPIKKSTNYQYINKNQNVISSSSISDNNSEKGNSKKSFEEKQSQTDDIINQLTLIDKISCSKTMSELKDKKSLIEITLDNCYNEESLLNLSFTGQTHSNLITKIDMIITSVRQKTKNNEKFLLQILEKLPLLLNNSINKIIISLSSFLSSNQLDKHYILSIFNIIINDLQMLIHTIPKFNYSVDNISPELKQELNEREKGFLTKMHRLRAFLLNTKLKYEI